MKTKVDNPNAVTQELPDVPQPVNPVDQGDPRHFVFLFKTRSGGHQVTCYGYEIKMVGVNVTMIIDGMMSTNFIPGARIIEVDGNNLLSDSSAGYLNERGQ